MYTCVAVNQEGDGESNPVQLDVKYRPLCRAGQQHTWGVGRGETIEIPCDVDSNPDDVQFTWRLNTTSDSVEIPASKHRADRARSYLSHTPQSERDYGTLLCWGTNALGTQKQPCTFHVIPAGKPNSPINCSLANQTTDSLTVTCSEGFDGGVPKQEFLLELYDEQTHALVSNVTDRLPVFTVGGLESGVDFRADLYAYNTKGRSEPVRMHAYTLKGAERRLAATQAALQITPLVGLLVGVVASLVLAAVLIVVVLRMRGRGEGHDEKSEDRRDKAATISASAGGKGDGKGEPEQGQGQGPTDENNPDLIPDKSADEFVDPEEKAFEYLNDRRLYSTLNPRLGLYSPSSIDHIGPNMPNGPKMDGEVTYAELSLQRPMGDPCIQRSMAPSPQPLSLGPMGGLGGPLSGPLSPMYGPGPGGPGGPGRGLLHTGPYGGGPGSAMTLPHPGQRGGLVSCLRRPPGGPPLGPAHEPTMYAQIAVCRGSLAHGPGLGQGLGLGPGRGRGDSLVEDVAGEAVEAPPMEHRDTSISSLQPLLDTRCNTIGGHGKGVGLMGKPPAAVTATRF